MISQDEILKDWKLDTLLNLSVNKRKAIIKKRFTIKGTDSGVDVRSLVGCYDILIMSDLGYLKEYWNNISSLDTLVAIKNKETQEITSITEGALSTIKDLQDLQDCNDNKIEKLDVW